MRAFAAIALTLLLTSAGHAQISMGNSMRANQNMLQMTKKPPPTQRQRVTAQTLPGNQKPLKLPETKLRDKPRTVDFGRPRPRVGIGL